MITLSQLLSAPKLRKKVVDIPGLGDIEITEYTAAEAWDITDAINKGDNNDSKLYARWALRALKGLTEPISDSECDALMANVGQGIITAIFGRALNFDATPAAVEEASKN